jgi:hypothetical protein
MTAAAATGPRVARLISIVLVFMVVGPPVGAMVFMLTVALIGLGARADLQGLTWVAMFAVIYAVPFSYLIGVGPAAAAGLIVGIRQTYFGRVRWWFALAAGIVVGVGFLLLTGQPLMRFGDEAGALREHSAVIVLTCLGATMVCWAIVRNWYMAPPRVEGAAS